MTIYFAFFVERDCIKFKTKFGDKKEAERYAKDYVKNTDGSFAVQIIGFDNFIPVYTKTFTAINGKPKVLK